MKDKINVAELLKDCPKGMELDCTSYDNVSFDKISDDKKATYPIFCYITDKEGNRSGISFTENGCESKRYGAKCVIFPKGKTTWKGFHRPFKDGDIIAFDSKGGAQLFIFKEYIYNNNHAQCYMMLDCDGAIDFEGGYYYVERFATEEEKAELFQAIKENGYKWNAKTKTLEKLIQPKFKVGNTITNGKTSITIGYIDNEYYYEIGRSIATRLLIKNQDEWELVPNKFDINTLVPFESKVLVRDYDTRIWIPTFWGKYLKDDSNCSYLTTNGCYKYCIPYEGNEHLLGTTDDCNEYFKT